MVVVRGVIVRVSVSVPSTATMCRPEFVAVMLTCHNYMVRSIYEAKPLPRGVRRPIHSASR